MNSRSHNKERVGQLLILQGKEHEQADEFAAGDIGAVAKLKETLTGDLLLDAERESEPPKIDFPEPVMSFAIAPKAKGDEEKLGTAIRRLHEEDPTLTLRRDQQTGEQLISGLSQMHVEVAVERIKSRFGVEVDLRPPRVPYLETIRSESTGHGRYKKQTGGRGQFGDCHIVLEPLEAHTGYEFVDKIVGGVIPQGFRPAVDKGIQEAMLHGELAGAPVQGIRVTLVDGSYHNVDSSEMAFKIAGSMAFKQAYEQADPVLLEPIMEVDVTVPDDAVGSVNGDLNSRRGRLHGHGARRRRHDDDQGRGAHGGDAHVLPVADLDDRRARRLPHVLRALRRGPDARGPEGHGRGAEGTGRGEGLRHRLTQRGAQKRAERERQVGVDPEDDAARWLAEHDPKPERAEGGRNPVTSTGGGSSREALVAPPGRPLQRRLERGPVVDRLAVRDDHALEGQVEQLAERGERLVPRRPPDQELAAGRGQRVREDERPLLR